MIRRLMLRCNSNRLLNIQDVQNITFILLALNQFFDYMLLLAITFTKELHMTYEPTHIMAATAAGDNHRQYSLDQIKSLLGQAAGIAEQEGLALLNSALTVMRDMTEACCR